MCVSQRDEPIREWFYTVKGASPIASETRKFGVEDFASVLGVVTLSVMDSVGPAIDERLSWTEPCVENSGREVFFSRRSVGCFLRGGRKEEPDNSQHSMAQSRHEQKDSLAIDKPWDSAVNQCSDSRSENLCGGCQSQNLLNGSDCALSQRSAQNGQGWERAITVFLVIFQ